MEHIMRLHCEPFEKIKSGIKKNEIRLNDEKRKLVKIGDKIEFLKRPKLKEKIVVLVTGINYFENYAGIEKHYSKDQIEKYGIVIFDFELMK